MGESGCIRCTRRGDVAAADCVAVCCDNDGDDDDSDDGDSDDDEAAAYTVSFLDTGSAGLLHSDATSCAVLTLDGEEMLMMLCVFAWSVLLLCVYASSSSCVAWNVCALSVCCCVSSVSFNDVSSSADKCESELL